MIGVSPGMILLANSSCSGWLRQRRTKAEARAGERMAGQPSGDTDVVDGGCGEHMLQVDLGQVDGAGAAQVHDAHTLGQRALNAGAPAVSGRERLLCLTRPRRLQRGMFLAPTQRE